MATPPKSVDNQSASSPISAISNSKSSIVTMEPYEELMKTGCSRPLWWGSSCPSGGASPAPSGGASSAPSGGVSSAPSCGVSFAPSGGAHKSSRMVAPQYPDLIHGSNDGEEREVQSVRQKRPLPPPSPSRSHD
ncbi:uncharacterized protein [Palaemon carinicauda]|uniref:uncharacterized protein n=1 Tax=Palaemon carinicauda TaxID=392227 RepID=UPI0035B63ED5